MQNFNFKPIGFFESTAQHKFERRRQPEPDNEIGLVHLHTGFNFEQALQGLQGFDYIWLIYLMDRNRGWKPVVRPPGFNTSQGLFATRAPYRPNPIGLSAVRLLEINKLTLTVNDHDLLDQTPILDIKPYLPYADSFPEAAIGWRAEARITYEISFNSLALKQLNWLESNGLTQLRGFIQEQLQHDPLEMKRKRIYKLDADGNYELAYRVWRIVFFIKNLEESATEDSPSILVKKIYSNYGTQDLQSSDDPYQDKDLHRHFLKAFAGQT